MALLVAGTGAISLCLRQTVSARARMSGSTLTEMALFGSTSRGARFWGAGAGDGDTRRWFFLTMAALAIARPPDVNRILTGSLWAVH